MKIKDRIKTMLLSQRKRRRRYVVYYEWCGFGFRRDFGRNTAARLVFKWVLRAGFVQIQCWKTEDEQNEAMRQILEECGGCESHE